MFNFFAKEGARSKSEILHTVTPDEALTMQSVWGNRKIKDEISSLAALTHFMAVDRSPSDGLLRAKSLENIRHILAEECRISFASDAELEQFVESFSMLVE